MKNSERVLLWECAYKLPHEHLLPELRDAAMSENEDTRSSLKFSGYFAPNYTPVPDQLFDEHLHLLSGAELKVLLYICRRTFGFKRDSDNISLNQMLGGIVKKDGTRLDHGTGLSKSTLLKAIKSLVDMNLIVSEQRSSESKGNEATNYRLNVRDSQDRALEGGVSEKNTPLGIKIDLGGDRFSDQALGIKIDPTINSSTTNSFTRDSNNNIISDFQEPAVDEDSVVVALTSRKIAKRVAEQLGQQFPLEHIQEKIAFYDFLVAERPADIKKPAAWLRSAIENDYSAPDGFLSPSDREILANEEKSRAEALVAAQEARQHAIAEAERLEEQIQERRLLWLHEKYSTSKEALSFWQAVQQTVEQTAGAATHGLIDDAYILTLNGSTAKVGIPSKFKLAQLAHPGTQTQINRAAKSIAQHEITIEFVLLDDLPG